MKARTLSLIGKAIGLVVILTTWAYNLFVLHQISAGDVLAYVGGIGILFADVATNLALEKFTKPKIEESPTPQAGA